MSSRRQDENAIVPSRRGVGTHTLSSANKIKFKENAIPSKSKSNPILRKGIDKSIVKNENSTGEEKVDKKDVKSIRKPLNSTPASSAPNARSALSSKPVITQHNPTAQSKPSTMRTNGKVSTTTTKRTIRPTGTPAQVKSAKLKSTLNVYTPGPTNTSTNPNKSKNKVLVEENDDIDDIEYMPPRVQEREYQSHLGEVPVHEDDIIFSRHEPEPEFNLRLDEIKPLNMDADAINHDDSFNIDLPDQSQFLTAIPAENDIEQDDFLLEI
ncbi:uncharacterized protein IL334_007747 [Kwoniella shivajii]|uniref:Securin n=1 Tax=Kwoniella shivajii TaxID=564305 RepID=A0ABZ1D9I9_9TREE|nr:hypothetical protein IL334_007747 [Kwoniella shivajii]